MDRILPWGETCRVAESRIKKAGWREAWKQRSAALRRANPMMDIHESAYQAMTEFPPSICDIDGEDVNALSEDDAAFVAKCREGLQMDLPMRAGIEKELDWLGSNINKGLPKLETCPSMWSLNYAIDLRTSAKSRDTFWATSLSKRLSPGDTSKKSKSAVKEDVTDVESENQDEDLRRRLFGEGE